MTRGALPEWLLRLLSVDTERLQGGTEHIRFARFPEAGLGLLAIVAIVLGGAVVLWNYRREGQLATWKKLTFAAVRWALLVVIALILFYPVLEVDRVAELRATTLVLIDESLSLGIRDRYQGDPTRRAAIASTLGIPPDDVAGSTRANLVERALASSELRLFDRLGEKNTLKGYTFSGLPPDPLALPVSVQSGSQPDDGSPESPDDPDNGNGNGNDGKDTDSEVQIEPLGRVTDIAGALRSAVAGEGNSRIAGIVLMTDGRVTAGEDLRSAAVFLREKGIPVHAVGVGDPTPSRNFRVEAVLASERVFTGDPVVVDVRISHQGLDGETARVELVDTVTAEGEAEQAPVILETKDVSFSEERTDATVSFRFEPDGVGKHRLTARIRPRPEETFSDDNTSTATVEVVRDASRVLLIAGSPSYEYRFLKNLLRRDSRIFLATWLMSADADYPQEGNVSLQKLPDTSKVLFEYDVVILVDIDPKGLTPGFPELLEQFVGKHRGGLAYVASEKFTGSLVRAPELAPLRNMLPVLLDPAQVRQATGRGNFYEREWPLEPQPAAMDHPATRLSSQIDRNRDRWAEIAGIYWSCPVRKLKPGATVLFAHSDPAVAVDGKPRPVVATQFYEGGRVMWCGIDSTWRWRATAEEVYDSFWIQSVRYLTESRLLGDRRRLLETDRESYDLGETLRVSALLSDENFRPLEVAEQTVLIEDPEGTITELRLASDGGSPGWYRGIFVPRLIGSYNLRLADGHSGNAAETPVAGTVEKTISVEPPAIEFEVPRLDEEALRELGSLTAGSYTPLAEIDAVPARIPDRRQTVVTTDEAIPLWDNWFSMSLLAGLLTLEWILRKANRLL